MECGFSEKQTIRSTARAGEMQFIFTICQWLEQTTVGTRIRESLWLFPIIETVHIFGIILLVGATSILDLRLMGLTFRDEAVSKLAQAVFAVGVGGFPHSSHHGASVVLLRGHQDVREYRIRDQNAADPGRRNQRICISTRSPTKAWANGTTIRWPRSRRARQV